MDPHGVYPITQIENRWELDWPHPLDLLGLVQGKRQAPLKPYLSPDFSHYIYITVSLPVFSLAISLVISLYFSSILPIPLFLSWFFFPSPYVSPWFISLAISPFIIFGGTSHPRFPPPFWILVSGIVHLQWMPSEPVKNQKTNRGAWFPCWSWYGSRAPCRPCSTAPVFFTWPLAASVSEPSNCTFSVCVCVCAKRSVPHREGCGNGSWLTLPTNRSDLISTGRKMWKRGMSGEGHLAFGLGFKLILTSSAGKTTKDVFSLNGGPCHFSRTKCRTTWQDAPSIDLCPQGCMVYMHTQTIYRSVNCHHIQSMYIYVMSGQSNLVEWGGG